MILSKKAQSDAQDLRRQWGSPKKLLRDMPPAESQLFSSLPVFLQLA